MRNSNRNICFIVATLLVLLNVFPFANATEQKKAFYSITPDSDVWKTFTTTAEMRAAIHIEEYELCDLPTKELLRAVLEYPLIIDIMAFSTSEGGIKHVSNYCTALRLFLDRADALQVIRAYPRDKDSLAKELAMGENRIGLAPYVLQDLEAFLSGTSEPDNMTTLYVYTPNGTPVEVESRSELTQAQIVQYNYDFMHDYPNASFVSPSSNKYNCHSYAWYQNSSANPYWMMNPSAYMSDGSYIPATSTYTTQKLFYYSGYPNVQDLHSAIMYDVTSNVLSSCDVISKWGQGPVMIHSVYYGPYGAPVSKWKSDD